MFIEYSNADNVFSAENKQRQRLSYYSESTEFHGKLIENTQMTLWLMDFWMVSNMYFYEIMLD